MSASGYRASLSASLPSLIGSATSEANKLVTARQTATIENQMQYLISTTVIGDDVTPISPADESDPSAGLLLTVYFETNGVAQPWLFSWDEERTTMAPERAQGAHNGAR